MRVILQFEKTGRARFCSHLDVLRVMQRALRRIGAPVSYSHGFNPRMLLFFATALSLGTESRGELIDIHFDRMIDVEKLVEDLNGTFPEGFSAVRARVADDKAPILTHEMKWAGYSVKMSEDCAEAAEKFMAGDTCIVSKRSKKGPKDVNIRPMVRALTWSAQENRLEMVLQCCDSNSLGPELLLPAMGIQTDFSVLRTALYSENEKGELTDLFDGGPV